jgi:DNA-binding transcriptional MerR regulator
MTAPSTPASRAVGVSYRRLDYWARCGYLRPEHAGGSGVWRRWPEHELRVAAVMVRLLDAGLTLAAAAEIARAAIDEGEATHYAHVAEGVYLVVVVDLDVPPAKPRRARKRPVAERSAVTR